VDRHRTAFRATRVWIGHSGTKWGDHTVCPKSYANRACWSARPFVGKSRRVCTLGIPGIRRQRPKRGAISISVLVDIVFSIWMWQSQLLQRLAAHRYTAVREGM
jgi:hypothetical protein